MLIRTIHSTDLTERDITPESLYLRRREFLRTGAVGALALGAPALMAGCDDPAARAEEPAVRSANTGGATWTPRAPASPFSIDETVTRFRDATRYNNFYEFGTDKGDPAKYSSSLKPDPWSVEIAGEVKKPGTVALEEVVSGIPVEERIYRLRCVEAWSMVIPWLGVPLGEVLKRFEPTEDARYVAFSTLVDPEQMPGQKPSLFGLGSIDWPYIEGLRMDEAMHPLAILATGMYGQALPNQNGAPFRLVVPWKYGFKSIKSIVKIELTREMPPTSWNLQAPGEYGFFANVNPEVDHPRWSQARERRIGDLRKRATLPFNGYADQVASLYTGMDLKKSF